MINKDSLRAVEAAQWTERFVKPLYGSYCFAGIPGLVRSLFGGQADSTLPASVLGPLGGEYDNVVLVFADAFGWRFFAPRCETSPLLRRFVNEGVVSKLTSQFPSTTAAHVTAIHTGLPVGQSGVYEWFYYEPLVDALIAPLYFSFAGDHQRETLRGAGVTPEQLFPSHTLYQDLQDLGVASFLFQYQDYALSPYTAVISRGAQLVPYSTLPEALSILLDLLHARRERGYYVLYFDKIDAICHHYGPDAPQTAAEIDAFLAVMETAFAQHLSHLPGRTLLLLTADHGQVAIDPDRTIYVNQQMPDTTPLLQTSRTGRPLVPAGAPRDMFLHVREDRLDAAEELLRERLAGRADVYRVADLVAQGFFGAGELSPSFLHRVGNLVILPYAGESVWWYEQGRFEQHYRGHHGGLTRDEMETLLLIQAYA